jgi:hypothetical protein
MRSECFLRIGGLRILGIGGLATLCLAGPAAGQEGATPADSAAGWEPRFIDADSYRDTQVLLHDWPALTALVRWSAPLAEAISLDEATLPAELVVEFRVRVGALAEAGPPTFLAARRDSVASILEAVEARLDEADAMLADSLPADVADPTGDERPNVADRDRTYATGPTAVRVPAGVDVGEADSLPGAEIAGGPAVTYVDLVAEALEELDGLVHLVRKSGESSPARGAAAPSSPPGTAPPRPAP